jgi:hypothetical protein
MQHLIPMTTDALFSDEVRALARELLDTVETAQGPLRIHGVAASNEYSRVRKEIRPDKFPNVYWVESGFLFVEGMHDTSIPILRRAAPLYFAAFGQDQISEPIDNAIASMAENGHFDRRHYHAVCLSFGVAIMPHDPLFDIISDSETAGSMRITSEAVAANIRFICDSGLSRHQQIDALAQAQNFINIMVDNFKDRAPRKERWLPPLRDQSFKVVYKSDAPQA